MEPCTNNDVGSTPAIGFFTQEEINNLLSAGYLLEEAQELRAKTIFEWENLKRLWDGKPQLVKSKGPSLDDPRMYSMKPIGGV